MDELTRHFHQHIENVTAQVRADHIHQTRLLTEHYIQRIAEVEYERDEIQAAREEEAQQAVDEYEELEEERDDLQREKEEWEQEKEELEDEAREMERKAARLQMNVYQLEADYEHLDREKDELEEEKQELEADKERLEEDEAEWIEARDDLEKRISELKLEKRQLLRKEVALRQHFGESERLRMADQKTGAEQVQRLARDLAREREEFAAYRIKAESQQRKYSAALKEQMDAVQRFAVSCITGDEDTS
jgi:chromosome segregation ATPase